MITLQTAPRTTDRAGTHQPTRPLDLVHLARMTLGDRDLEREVLQLFVRQSAQLIARMAGADVVSVGALAHTLKGSARGLGAWRVAEAAEAVEQADADTLAARVAVLRAAAEEAYELYRKLWDPWPSPRALQTLLDNLDAPEARDVRPDQLIDTSLLRELEASGWLARHLTPP